MSLLKDLIAAEMNGGGGGGGAEDFVITGTIKNASTLSLDKTRSEIYVALASHKRPVLYIPSTESYLYPFMVSYNSNMYGQAAYPEYLAYLEGNMVHIAIGYNGETAEANLT